jgi:hypothetical protein
MSSWDQANRGGNIGLFWRNRKKISHIINEYLYLPFFLLIILWVYLSVIGVVVALVPD